jgi:membrane protease YdiL (CAAX protease family)
MLFVALPLAFRFKVFPFPPIPALWILASYCLWRLLSDPTFDRNLLWNAQALPQNLTSMVFIFAVFAALASAGIYHFRPDLMFNLVRRAPLLWGLVMMFYPIASVYPQGIVYRAFLFHRYSTLFPSVVLLILVSATAFAFVHIIFRNPLSIALTFAGGLLFAWRYQQSGSLFTSSLEHALYGCLMFTIGLGEYFYKGAR